MKLVSDPESIAAGAKCRILWRAAAGARLRFHCRMPRSPLPQGAVLVVAGATATGKSALAAALAARLDGEVICGDAFQLLAGLPVLTAQPGPAELALAPHHLYGAIAPDAPMDAARFAALATPVIDDVIARGRLPIVTGGSGLYLKALTHGLSPLPPPDAALRRELEALPADEAVRRLLALDPAAADTLNLRNPRHVQRALEICILAGRPASTLRTSFDRGPDPRWAGLHLVRERADLHARIDARTRLMLQADVVDEAAAAAARGLAPTAARAIGFAEFAAVAAGTLSPDAAAEAVAAATRRYAKRQDTWFRRETWMHPLAAAPDDGIEPLTDRALALLSGAAPAS